MRIQGPNASSPAPATAPAAAEDTGASSSARTGGPVTPDSLVDVRLIANPELVRPKPPVRSAQEARRAAGEAAEALKAEPKRAAQVAGKVRPEAAAAAVVAPPSAERPTPAGPDLVTQTLQVMKAEG
jgi:hypothetical protein